MYGDKGLLASPFGPSLTDTHLAAWVHPILQGLPKDDPALTLETLLWLVKERRE
jgi:hypothetical protein